MITGLWGKKIGMTQIFSEEKVVPVTAVDVSGWVVTNIKTKAIDGYSAVQIGRIKDRYVNKKFDMNWLKNPRTYFSVLREIKLSNDVSESEKSPVVVGKPADFLSIFAEGDSVNVFGTSKGSGFAGVVRRYNFGGPPGSHGATMGKRTGSIGFMCSVGRVIKGKKMPGHMGNRKCFAKNLTVAKLKKDSDLVLLKGSVPGKSGSLVFLQKA